jgi:hypothetical protein
MGLRDFSSSHDQSYRSSKVRWNIGAIFVFSHNWLEGFGLVIRFIGLLDTACSLLITSWHRPHRKHHSSVVFVPVGVPFIVVSNCCHGIAVFVCLQNRHLAAALVHLFILQSLHSRRSTCHSMISVIVVLSHVQWFLPLPVAGNISIMFHM